LYYFRVVVLEYYFRVKRMSASRLPRQVFDAKWKRPGSSLMLLTRWQKYVSSLLTKYGIDMGAASGPALQCKRHIRRQVAKVYDDRVADVAAEKSTLRTYLSQTIHSFPRP
jgi:hypothetical protein